MPGPNDKPIRLLHVINTLDVGGAERMLVKLVEHLDPAHFQCTIVTLTGEGSLNQQARDAGAEVIELNMHGARNLPRALWKLKRIIREYRPDILQSWLYHADLLATLARGACPTAPLIWTIRCTDMALSQYGRMTRTVRWLLAKLSPRPDLILANSQAGLDWHVDYGYRPRASAVIPNGFDLQRFHPDHEAREELRAELGLTDDVPLIGAVARVDPMKDYENFLAAAALVAMEDPHMHVLVVGKDTETLLPGPPPLKGRLHALGVRGDIERILPALDVFCLPSAFGEGFPNVLGEAMACGVACAVTDVGDAAAILGDCGPVVNPRQADEMAAAITGLLGLPPYARRSLGAQAAARVAQHFEVATVVGRFAETYVSILEDRS
jgi:glycosyltransferase involved in cell wall biosynthesis